jgi:hypothetical protein
MIAITNGEGFQAFEGGQQTRAAAEVVALDRSERPRRAFERICDQAPQA